MFVKEYGSGGRWIFGIPGWGEDHRCYRPLARYLPPRGRLTACDLPGYGLSAPPAEITVTAVLEQLQAAYLAHASDDSPPETVVGNCSGAVLAAELLRICPLQPQRLVLIDPFAFVPSYFKLFLRRGFGRVAYNTTFASSLGRMLTNLLLWNRRQRDTDLMATFHSVDHDVNYRYLQVFDSLGSIERFRPLRLPVTIITGKRTFAAVRRSLDMWREIWPQSDVRQLAGVGHLPIREAPDAVTRLLLPPRHGEHRR